MDYAREKMQQKRSDLGEKWLRYKWLSELADSKKFPDFRTCTRRLEAAKKEYKDTLENKALDDKFGFRMREMRDGEKPSNYFCNLMKNNTAQNYIPRRIDDDGVMSNSQTEVEDLEIWREHL